MNAGQFLSSLSGLSGVSAAQHLAAIQTGKTIFAYRADVQINAPALRIMQRPKREVARPLEQEQKTRRLLSGSKYVFSTTNNRRSDAFTEKNEVFVTTTTESVSV